MKTRNGFYPSEEVSVTSIEYKKPRVFYMNRWAYNCIKNIIMSMFRTYVIFCVFFVSMFFSILGYDYIVNNY